MENPGASRQLSLRSLDPKEWLLPSQVEIEKLLDKHPTPAALQGYLDYFKAELEWLGDFASPTIKGPDWLVTRHKTLCERLFAMKPEDKNYKWIRSAFTGSFETATEKKEFTKVFRECRRFA